LEKARQLNSPDRFLLIEELIQSFNGIDKEIEAVWADEAEMRLKAYREGKLKIMNYEEVFGEDF
jgi:putative addiction module component (TIGR02574 family)